MNRGISIHDIDLSKCGPNSPLHELAKTATGKVRKKARDLEHIEQRQVIAWRDRTVDAFPELAMLVAVPNGGFRSKRTAGRLKAEGVSPGYPDLLLDVARGGYHGLRIELKAVGGKLSDSQKGWQVRLLLEGYRAVVCFGWESARDTLIHYLSLRQP